MKKYLYKTRMINMKYSGFKRFNKRNSTKI